MVARSSLSLIPPSPYLPHVLATLWNPSSYHSIHPSLLLDPPFQAVKGKFSKMEASLSQFLFPRHRAMGGRTYSCGDLLWSKCWSCSFVFSFFIHQAYRSLWWAMPGCTRGVGWPWDVVCTWSSSIPSTSAITLHISLKTLERCVQKVFSLDVGRNDRGWGSRPMIRVASGVICVL